MSFASDGAAASLSWSHFIFEKSNDAKYIRHALCDSSIAFGYEKSWKSKIVCIVFSLYAVIKVRNSALSDTQFGHLCLDEDEYWITSLNSMLAAHSLFFKGPHNYWLNSLCWLVALDKYAGSLLAIQISRQYHPDFRIVLPAGNRTSASILWLSKNLLMSHPIHRKCGI